MGPAASAPSEEILALTLDLSLSRFLGGGSPGSLSSLMDPRKVNFQFVKLYFIVKTKVTMEMKTEIAYGHFLQCISRIVLLEKF